MGNSSREVTWITHARDWPDDHVIERETRSVVRDVCAALHGRPQALAGGAMSCRRQRGAARAALPWAARPFLARSYGSVSAGGFSARRGIGDPSAEGRVTIWRRAEEPPTTGWAVRIEREALLVDDHVMVVPAKQREVVGMVIAMA